MNTDRKQLEEFFGTEEKILSQKNACEESMAAIQAKLVGSVMICKHNSILVIKNEDEQITHVINPDTEKGLVILETLDEHLAVPRYTPEVAKRWLEDEAAKLTGGDAEITRTMKKAIVSEYELSLSLLSKLENRLEYYSSIIKAYESVA